MSKIKTGDFFKALEKHLDFPKAVIITDKNVYELYRNNFPDFPKIVLEPGEEEKTLENVEKIYKEFLRIGVDRSTFIAGVGGGVICDLTGFSASTYLRGLRFGFFPTTLLAQADAAIGGKNGVNYSGFKNLIGSIIQPEFVYSDISVLTTLPERELRNGFAEIIKHGLIRDLELFRFMEEKKSDVTGLDKKTIKYILERSKSIKMGIVISDEKESGERRNLNFGHTFGHVFEELLSIPHGEAVALGMVWAAYFSKEQKLIGPAEIERIKNLLEKYQLPVSAGVDGSKVKSFLFMDKKRDSGDLSFVFLEQIGHSVVKKIPMEEIEGFIDDMCQPG